MAATLTFLAVFLAHFAVTAIQIRLGFIMLVFLYGVYPKLLSLGLSEQAYALSGQRAMLYVISGFYLLRALWGSADVRYGLNVASRYSVLVLAVTVYLAARLGGNLVTARMDLGSFAALVNQFVVSALVILLVVTYVRTKRDIHAVLIAVTASLLLNQFAAVIEFLMGQSLFSGAIEIQYQTDEERKLVEGSIRAGYFRSRGFFDNPLKLTGFVCLAVPAAIALAQTSRVFLVKYFAFLAVVLAPVTVLFTGSRTGVAVLGLMGLWYGYAYLVRGIGPWGRFILNVMAVMAAMVVVVVVATGVADAWFFGSEYARSTESRALQFLRVPIALGESPLFGFGYARNIVDMLDVGHVDSFFLTTALEGGLVAVGALVFLMYRSLGLMRQAAKFTNDQDMSTIARHLAVTVAFAFLLALVISVSQIRFYLFLIIGLSIVMHHSLGLRVSSATTSQSRGQATNRVPG